MASLYQEPDWSTKLETVKNKIIQRLSGPAVSWGEAFDKLKKYYNEKDIFSLTDVWAVIVVTTYVKEMLSLQPPPSSPSTTKMGLFLHLPNISMLGPPLHPPHHLQTGSPLYLEDARMSSPPSTPPPPDGPLPYFAGGELRPCLRLQAGYADSVPSECELRTGPTPKNLIVC
ncbi:unnamed protein product [Leuciscus chuanchicus]